MTRTWTTALCVGTSGMTAWAASQGSGPLAFQLGLLGVGMLVVGVPHGAMDHLSAPPGQRNAFRVSYLVLAALFAWGWWQLPWLGAAAFGLLSAWHFGDGDARRMQVSSDWYAAFAWTRGAMVVVLLAAAPPLLSVDQLALIGLPPSVPSGMTHALVGAHLVVVALAARPEEADPALLEAGVLAAWLTVCEPVLGFAGYFVLWHSADAMRVSLRHGLRVLLPHALPHCMGALVLVAVSVALAKTHVPPATALAGAVILSSSLAVPHVVWTSWVSSTRSERGLREGGLPSAHEGLL